LTEGEHSTDSARRAELLALVGELRPELHRYCARLMGSVIDGEDVVQDTLARAFVALDGLSGVPPLRAWLFRIAHNRVLDLLRSRAIRAAEPIEAAHNVADQATPDPVEILILLDNVERPALQLLGRGALDHQGRVGRYKPIMYRPVCARAASGARL
jgi:RNA polymerase sigma factor (sigma-70 family)